jgi:hypothetical protein
MVGKTVGAKYPTKIYKVYKTGIETAITTVKGIKGATKGKTYYIKTQAKAGKAVTKVYEGPIFKGKVLKTIKQKAAPTVKFTEPTITVTKKPTIIKQSIIKKGEKLGDLPKIIEFTKEIQAKITKAKSVSMVKGYKIKGGEKVRITETLETITQKPKITIRGKPAADIKGFGVKVGLKEPSIKIHKTTYKHVKHPVKEPSQISEIRKGEYTIKRPAVAKTVQRTTIKETFDIEFIKAAKAKLPGIKGKKGHLLGEHIVRQIQRPTGVTVISKPTTLTVPQYLLKPIVKVVPILIPKVISRVRTRGVARTVGAVRETAVIKEAAIMKVRPITRVMPKVIQKVIPEEIPLTRLRTITTLRGIPRQIQRTTTTPGRPGYDFTIPTPKQPPKVPPPIRFKIYGGAIAPGITKKQLPTKKKFKGMPSLSVVMGSQGVQLTKAQIAGKAFISPFIPRKV